MNKYRQTHLFPKSGLYSHSGHGWRGKKGQNFFQGLEVIYPDGKIFLNQRIKVDSGQEKANVGINFQGFPVGQPGKYTINVWMERDGVKVTDIFPTSINIIIKALGRGEIPPGIISVKANPVQ